MWRFTSPKSNRNVWHGMNTLKLYLTFYTEVVTFKKFTTTCIYIGLCYLLLKFFSYYVFPLTLPSSKRCIKRYILTRTKSVQYHRCLLPFTFLLFSRLTFGSLANKPYYSVLP